MLRPKKIRLILAMAIVLAGVSLIATVMLKVEQRKPPAEKLDPLPDNVEMALQKVHYSEVKDGIKKWDLFADQALFDMKKEAFHLKGVRLVLVAETRIGDITLTADGADYYSKTKDVELSGNVVAKSDTGMHFSSATARFVGANALIRTDDPVRFTDGRIEVSGVGMELKTTTRDLKIKKGVTADIMNGHSK
ncbi:lipopolysaccharide ABC transporter, periplasmic protein LptC [Geotalea daltonii FRC-32]|uniref:Lipopolysaccharide ABC transporter, periplasmic protein LptC n=1 Tax=Geotalea daltonii (strain DSM 22248 / JCM 15807 / FRC-32) TaxID=316067 RepID=B9M9Q9_GEODF|nr:LPS export ABC transporter periplasmic protein LptC [Geotalea daltonii]ACM20631.1 lipopolysaccharide ABC transporter, periplasmic protein LptC [Geotalea daltonii FRC-32]